MANHYVLCGLGKVGRRVLEILQAAQVPVVVVDTQCSPDDPILGGCKLVTGDCRSAEVLNKAEITTARGVLIVTSNDLINLSTTLMVRHLHPHVRMVVRMFNQSLLQRLKPTLGNVVSLSTSALAAPLLASIARTGEALGAFKLGDGSTRNLTEVAVAAGSPLLGRTVRELPVALGVTAVVHVPLDHEQRFPRSLEPTATLSDGDRVVLCGPPDRLSALSLGGSGDSIPELLWGNAGKRLVRVFRRLWSRIDLPVKICSAIFFGTIFVSILVFHFGMNNDTLVDAFYRTISLMATGADMHGDDAGPGTWQKAFISGLRLVGVALTAAFTAILTNYLIRANLGGALEVRRMPDRGHIIVCGLGNVGFRAVQDLLDDGESVLVLEQNPDNAFISTARRLGAAVIVANATIPEVLKDANVSTARALIAATSDELVNLEIALLASELGPRQRVVVRLSDPALARTLRKAANVRLALSIPDLAAPAFVASLLGDQVWGLFLIEDRLLAACDLALGETDPENCVVVARSRAGRGVAIVELDDLPKMLGAA